MRQLFSLILITLLSACASTYEVTPSGRTLRTSDQYMEVLEQHSDKIRSYSGFYNVLDVEGVALNSKVAAAQLDQNMRLYQWTEERYQEEKVKFEQRLSKQAEFFVSFFTPERKNDDLFKDTTMWRIFLDVDGRRFEGKATRVKLPLAEIQGIYPFHNRFATPYIFTFPVPMLSVEGKEMKLTMTGPVGSGTLTIQP
ncbi:hypothetical protein EZJ49_15625 [Bdellovibrio bacteriovorus]|uniref:hypothetical protein n=1 Tax=Bdellovibrio bacteriovorus TaxID=959 RepID=UPI0021D009F6|nr:hypothetical protein [Bdellovibrio bacteriovorus]UXR64498.1 hypothetical protein EZJ49_15625 [Bdellovibrio bacteriovorus]